MIELQKDSRSNAYRALSGKIPTFFKNIKLDMLVIKLHIMQFLTKFM